MAAGILNEEKTFDSAPANVQKAFTGGRATKILLQAGHGLYKFTHHPLFKSDGTATPWWSSVTPLANGDPGLAGNREAAARLGVSDQDFVRANSAVTKQWNRLSNCVQSKLLVPVYGFAGRCSAQRIDDDHSENVVYIGGAWQMWIPGLDQRSLAPA